MNINSGINNCNTNQFPLNYSKQAEVRKIEVNYSQKRGIISIYSLCRVRIQRPSLSGWGYTYGVSKKERVIMVIYLRYFLLCTLPPSDSLTQIRLGERMDMLPYFTFLSIVQSDNSWIEKG